MHAVEGPFTATPREQGPPSTARTVHGALPVKQRMPACSRELTWALLQKHTGAWRGTEVSPRRGNRGCA